MIFMDANLAKAKAREYVSNRYKTDPEYREKHKEYSRKYYAANKEKLKKYFAKYTKKHAKELREYALKYHRIKNGIPLEGKPCQVCGDLGFWNKYCKPCAKQIYIEQHREAARNYARRKAKESK